MKNNNITIIEVYAEMNDSKYAEKVATFHSEQAYVAALPQLVEWAKANGFDQITEREVENV